VHRRHDISVEGEDIVAVHHPGPGDQWLVCCHGLVSDKEGTYEGRCERAVAEGYHAVRFDHRGCGEADGDFAEQTLETRMTDLHAVLDYFDPTSVVLFGSSFGGKVAFHVAPERPEVMAVATRAPVTVTDGYPDPGRRQQTGESSEASDSTENSPVDQRPFLEALVRHEFGEVQAALSCPVAIFHGREDETVPVEDSLTAIEGLDTDVYFQQYAGEGHRFSRAVESRLREQLFDWLETVQTSSAQNCE